MYIETLQKNIESKTATIGIVGLGYVGLAVACKFAEAGFSVIGLERIPEKVDMINAGILPIRGDEPGLEPLLQQVTKTRKMIATTDLMLLEAVDIVLVAVETPVDLDSKVPNYDALNAALASIGSVIKPGTLIVIESTIAPGTMAGIVCPALEKASGLTVDRDFFLGHCPERVMPGRLLRNLSEMSRVCGGHTPETSQVMVGLYRHIVQAELDLTDSVTAEMVKTTENAYRDVQIAFANEIALICEKVGVDVWALRDLVNKSPGRNLHLPGAGVGGHCIPKDPWLLVHSANGTGGTPPSLIPTARLLNDGMPHHIAELVLDALAEVGCSLKQAKIAVLGYAYLENSDDTRNSPSQVLISHLQMLGANVVIHDPCVPEFQGELKTVIQGADALVVMVRHSVYQTLPLADLKSLLKYPILIDGRRVFDPELLSELGFVFRSIGWGKVPQ